MKIITNPNKEKAAKAREAVERNDGYCPCALDKTTETKCMCFDFINKVENGYIGECNCGLYKAIKEDW